MIKLKRAFTLIELLIVISIIGILSTLVAANLNAAREKARDVQRKSDLKQFQAALENYANNNSGLYSATNDIGTMCTNIGMTTCPADPKDGDGDYGYIYKGSVTDYILAAKLEDPKTLGNYWLVCSNGKSGEYTPPIPLNEECPDSL